MSAEIRSGILVLLLFLLNAHSPPGVTEAMMLAHRFTNEMLARLIIDGLATLAPEPIRASGRRIEIARLQITEAGLRALTEPDK